jgi:hypothetical protein
MYYAFCFGLLYVGPFVTAASVQFFAERLGIDDWDLVELPTTLPLGAVIALPAYDGLDHPLFEDGYAAGKGLPRQGPGPYVGLGLSA